MAPLIVMLTVWLLSRLIGATGLWSDADSWTGALRVALAAMFVFTAISHFHPRTRSDLIRMVPARLPTPVFLVSSTGVLENVGAWILGRNMFGPIRDGWPDDGRRGWWGDNPPYHTDVFILTHHARGPIEMAGGTTFHFVTDGVQVALEQAKSAAKGKDVRLGGGVSTIRQFLQARLIDEMHIAISPVMLGEGEHLFGGIDTLALGYLCTKHAASPNATHFVLTRQP